MGPTGAGYRYDIAVPALKVLVEYDSELHYSFNKHFHGTKKEFLAAKERDRAKEMMAKEAGWALLRVEEGRAGSELLARREIERRAGRKTS